MSKLSRIWKAEKPSQAQRQLPHGMILLGGAENSVKSESESEAGDARTETSTTIER
jgi:hypothetical protein